MLLKSALLDRHFGVILEMMGLVHCFKGSVAERTNLRAVAISLSATKELFALRHSCISSVCWIH